MMTGASRPAYSARRAVRRRRGGRSDDHSVGVQEVVHRGALAQELGVRHDGDVRAPEHRLDGAGGADRHGRLVDDERARPQHGGDLGRRRPRGSAGRHRRRAPGGSRRTGTRTRRRLRRRAAPTTNDSRPAADPSATSSPRPASTIGISPRSSRSMRSGIDVGAHHVVAEVGEVGGRGEPDVTGPDHGDRCGLTDR